MTDERPPVVEVTGRFADDLLAAEVAEALNRWLQWILQGSDGPLPEAFEPLGVPTSDYAWSLADDVDWEVGPHARAIGDDVRIAVQTEDTHVHLGGLLRRLGATSTRVTRESP